MSVAPNKPPPPPEVVRVQDALRVPKVRQTMHLFVPRVSRLKDGTQRIIETKVSVTESRASVRLTLDIDNDGIGVKSVELSISEASKLADLLNTIRRKVAARPDWRP